MAFHGNTTLQSRDEIKNYLPRKYHGQRFVASLYLAASGPVLWVDRSPFPCYGFGCESQFKPEPAKRAATAAWRGGRVLICIQRFIEPHRQTRRWGFCLVKQERRRHNY
jgi:hypothetical protein